MIFEVLTRNFYNLKEMAEKKSVFWRVYWGESELRPPQKRSKLSVKCSFEKTEI